ASVDVLTYHEITRSFFLSEPPDQQVALDDIDLLVIASLQRDGRMGFSELGERVGLSATAARARFMRLLDANIMRIGAIRRRDPESASIAVGLGIRTHGRSAEVESHLGALTGIEFIARCFGRFDLVATVATASAASAAEV